MAVEAKRGCGYRKVGGLYLVSDPGGMPCDRLPIPLSVCPTCNHGIKQARGFTWVDVAALVGDHADCHDDHPCPICMGTALMGKAGLLWIGEKFYPTPESFDREADEMGVSRRIHALPRNFKVGETWVLMAHPKAICNPCTTCHGSGLASKDGVVICERCAECGGERYIFTAAITKVWRPQRLEKILPESMRDSEMASELEERGVTPVFVPDNDPDHRGSVYDVEEEEEED